MLGGDPGGKPAQVVSGGDRDTWPGWGGCRVDRDVRQIRSRWPGEVGRDLIAQLDKCGELSDLGVSGSAGDGHQVDAGTGGGLSAGGVEDAVIQHQMDESAGGILLRQ